MTVASVLIAFAVAILAFRIWRERRKRAEGPGGLAGMDYLILAPIILSVFLVELPLLTIPTPSPFVQTVAQGSCAASAALIAVYPLAIVDRRRIEKMEFALFGAACALAGLSSVVIFLYC